MSRVEDSAGRFDVAPIINIDVYSIDTLNIGEKRKDIIDKISEE